MKVAIITTHPIQYNAPLFELLSKRGIITLKVFYTWGPSVLGTKYDPGFKQAIEWDIPLLHGYDYSFVENIAKDKGSHHFKGIDNPGLLAAVREWKADAIIVYGWAFKSHLKLIRHFKMKIPVFFRGDSTLLDETEGFDLKKVLRKLFLQWVYRHVDYALYVGNPNKAYYLKMGLKEKQLFFVPHTVDNERFENKSSASLIETSALRHKLGIASDAVVLLFAGKLEEKKNPIVLGEALESLGNNQVHLVYVGNGVLEYSLKERFSSNKNIHFIDFQNQLQLPVLYGLSDLFVLPSKGPGETWGLAINEAMACGKAVLVSDACGAAFDLVQEGHNGYIFKSKDKGDLLAKLRAMTENPFRLKEMGVHSQQIITNWNYETACVKIENALLSTK